MQNSDILFEEISGTAGKLGLITLNRPKALNALSHEMFNVLDHHLSIWETSSTIKAVLIRAVEGRAFCAGGDVRQAYERKLSQHPQLSNFFHDEYALNRRIFHYKKPYIALLDGITMGGGAGISIHGSHRIATEKLVFAMPETSIGFFPDVGGSYFLSRLPYKSGFYLGLTGEHIPYQDCYALGLVDEVIQSDTQHDLINALVNSEIPDKMSVNKIIKPFATSVPDSLLLNNKQEIVTCFDQPSVEDILHALHQSKNTWSQKVAKIIETKSPTSLKVTLQALLQGENLDFDACMDMEYRITTNFLHSHDFFEGVRAALVDKDRNPQWKPAKLAEVSNAEVKRYFE